MAEKEGFGTLRSECRRAGIRQVSTGHLHLGGSNPSFLIRQRKEPLTLWGERFFSLAEKEGFEPSIPFWGIHDFQSCALGQLRDFSMRLLASCRLTDSFDMILQTRPFVKLFFLFFQFSVYNIVTARRFTEPSIYRAQSEICRKPHFSWVCSEAVFPRSTWEYRRTGPLCFKCATVSQIKWAA